MALLPNVQAGPYRWQIDNPAAGGGPWSDPWDIGIVEDAPEEEWNPEHEEITGDNLGATIQDVLFRGANLFISMVVQEFGTAAWRALQPYYNRANIPGELNEAFGDGGLSAVGMFARATAHTPVTEVSAFRARALALYPNFSTSLPSAIYFPRLSLAPNQPASFRRGSRLKNIGVRFICFPHYAYADPTTAVENTVNPLVFYQTV